MADSDWVVGLEPKWVGAAGVVGTSPPAAPNAKYSGRGSASSKAAKVPEELVG